MRFFYASCQAIHALHLWLELKLQQTSSKCMTSIAWLSWLHKPVIRKVLLILSKKQVENTSTWIRLCSINSEMYNKTPRSKKRFMYRVVGVIPTFDFDWVEDMTWKSLFSYLTTFNLNTLRIVIPYTLFKICDNLTYIYVETADYQIRTKKTTLFVTVKSIDQFHGALFIESKLIIISLCHNKRETW